jgi:hypothetical protein
MLRVMWAGVCLLGVLGLLGGTSLVLATPPRPALQGKGAPPKSPLALKQGMGGLPSGSKPGTPGKSSVPLSQLKLKDVTINKGGWKKVPGTDDPPSTEDPGPTPITTAAPTPTCPTSVPTNDGPPTTGPNPSSGVLSRFQWKGSFQAGGGVLAPNQKSMILSK